MPVDPAALLASLSRTIDGLEFEDGELERRLDESLETAAQVVIAGAGTMRIDEDGQLRLIGAANRTARARGLTAWLTPEERDGD